MDNELTRVWDLILNIRRYEHSMKNYHSMKKIISNARVELS